MFFSYSYNGPEMEDVRNDVSLFSQSLVDADRKSPFLKSNNAASASSEEQQAKWEVHQRTNRPISSGKEALTSAENWIF